MPHVVARPIRAVMMTCVLLALAACGGKQADNTTPALMKDLGKVDGTITDAMTDLDGVRAEGTALVDTGNASAAGTAGPARAAATNAAAEDDSSAEVVADQ